jgi:hypothetical protein
LERAKKEQRTAEKVVATLYRVGDTLRNARHTFTAFVGISTALSGVIVFAGMYQ